ncbi:universal stress protein [Roseiconus nitratireducens]|nr:universal stress protein [Roseiconus nitratireducens]
MTIGVRGSRVQEYDRAGAFPLPEITMKVLLATDRSDQAAAAAKFLMSLRFKEPMELTIVTALGDPYGSNPDSTQHWFPELLKQERARMEQHQHDLSKLMSPRCRSIETVCRAGHPVKIILAEAQKGGHDLIVMGAIGHSLIGRLLVGSVSDNVATHAKCSVLIVRPGETSGEKGAEESHTGTRISIGYDRSKASRQAVQEMLDLQWEPDTEVKLIGVAPIYDYLLGNGLSTAAVVNEEEVFREMQTAGENMRDEIIETLPNVKSVVKHDQRVGDAIVEEAAKNHSDLIVVGDSGHSMLDDLLLGSTTKYVLRHARCSVWISRHHRRVDAGAESTATSNASA